MGSAGTGRFGDYRISDNSNASSSQISGGSSEVECPQVLDYIKLEDVSTSDYFVSHNNVPQEQAAVQLKAVIHFGRLVVNLAETGEIIGNMPTQYNSILNCIQNGMNYSGHIISSGLDPIPFIVVRLNAI